MKINTRYFPFSPGIGWKIKSGKYIVPEINLDVWKRITQNKSITVVCYGGLFESYFSLSYLEMLNYITPQNKLFWCGNNKFSSLVSINGLAQLSDKCPQNILTTYPVPVFMDVENNLYFNCLNNYQKLIPYYGGKGYKDKTIITKQLFRNSTLSWELQYLSKFRNIENNYNDLSPWIRNTRFNINKPYVCICLDTDYSKHSVKSLSWNENDIKYFANTLLKQGISTVLITKHPGKFHNSALYCLPSLKIEWILQLFSRTEAILANEVDFLLLGMMLSSTSKIITRRINRTYDLQLNARYLKIHRPNINVIPKLTPLNAINIINA